MFSSANPMIFLTVVKKSALRHLVDKVKIAQVDSRKCFAFLRLKEYCVASSSPLFCLNFLIINHLNRLFASSLTIFSTAKVVVPVSLIIFSLVYWGFGLAHYYS